MPKVPYSTFQAAKLLHSFIVWAQTLLAILAWPEGSGIQTTFGSTMLHAIDS